MQGWLDNPAANFGWLLRGNETQSQSAHGFATRESPAGDGPRLTIEFTPAVPEPASLTLFVVGVLAQLLKLEREGREWHRVVLVRG